ncbi:MAG: RIP metalloprotease RseP [Puniceicoccales bacterium]|jgi:RIP metalloprotease RseP|nr:RIP metalloprotease RseP [Puniceicoccales bacterium]
MPSFDFIGAFLILFFFGGSIFVHELGHFLAARKRGLKVERFSIGFGPRIFGWTGKDGVDYRISLLPLGGYVALPQMVDMQAIEGKNDSDPEALPPISYADKLIVAVMGVVFNFLFAIAIACVLWVTGRPLPSNSATTTIGYVASELPGRPGPSPAAAAGLRPGDKILGIDGSPVTDFMQITNKIALGGGRDANGNPEVILKIERDGSTLDVTVKPRLIVQNPESGDVIRHIGIAAAGDIIIEKPVPGSPASIAGLRQGDAILSLDGVNARSFNHFRQLLAEKGTREVKIEVLGTNGTKRTHTLTPVMLTHTAELADISFDDKGTTRKLTITAVPDNALATPRPPENAPRRNLMLCDTSALPIGSSYASVLRPGAIITDIDSPAGILAVKTLAELENAAKKINKKEPATISFKNGKRSDTLHLENFKVTLRSPEKTPFIGVTHAIKSTLVHQPPHEQVGAVFRLTIDSISALINRNTDVGVGQLMGVISIAKTYYTSADDIRRVLWFTIIININLAILNILPFPVLDGGHILFATIQKIMGRPLPLKMLLGVQYLFFALLFLLMGYVLLNDVKRCNGDNTEEIRQIVIKRYVNTPITFPPQTSP